MTQGSPIGNLTLEQLLAAASAPAIVEAPPPFRWSYCRYCKRYYAEPPGSADCPDCEREFAVRLETESELGKQYAAALLLVQPLMHHEEAGLELLERLTASMAWTSPVNPMFFDNANNAQIRKAINALRGIAARYGLLATDQGGRELEIELRGERWIAVEDNYGAIRPLRRVPVVADANAAVSPEWEAEEKRARGVLCPECGLSFASNFALAGHRRSHGS